MDDDDRQPGTWRLRAQCRDARAHAIGIGALPVPQCAQALQAGHVKSGAATFASMRLTPAPGGMPPASDHHAARSVSLAARGVKSGVCAPKRTRRDVR
jgi:hypothetical protein